MTINQVHLPRSDKLDNPITRDNSIVTCTLGHREYVDAINLDGSAASSKDSNPTVVDVEAEQKRNWAKTVYYPALDALISECSQRFSSELMGIACGVDAICNVNFQESESLIRHYDNLISLDLDLVRAEMNLLRAMLPHSPLSTGMKTQIKEELLKGLYPNFCKLCRVALCIPVATATCESSFSASRRIRNYLRVTMGQERFSNFGFLNIENDITTKVDSENILNLFASIASRSLMFC